MGGGARVASAAVGSLPFSHHILSCTTGKHSYQVNEGHPNKIDPEVSSFNMLVYVLCLEDKLIEAQTILSQEQEKFYLLIVVHIIFLPHVSFLRRAPMLQKHETLISVHVIIPRIDP